MPVGAAWTHRPCTDSTGRRIERRTWRACAPNCNGYVTSSPISSSRVRSLVVWLTLWFDDGGCPHMMW